MNDDLHILDVYLSKIVDNNPCIDIEANHDDNGSDCKEVDNIPNYERLFQGTVQEQVSIARIFKKHIEIKDKIIQQEKS